MNSRCCGSLTPCAYPGNVVGSMRKQVARSYPCPSLLLADVGCRNMRYAISSECSAQTRMYVAAGVVCCPSIILISNFFPTRPRAEQDGGSRLACHRDLWHFVRSRTWFTTAVAFGVSMKRLPMELSYSMPPYFCIHRCIIAVAHDNSTLTVREPGTLTAGVSYYSSTCCFTGVLCTVIFVHILLYYSCKCDIISNKLPVSQRRLCAAVVYVSCTYI